MSTKRFVLFRIYLFILFLHTCFQLVAFVTEHIWQKALLMGYSMRLETTNTSIYIYIYILHGSVRDHAFHSLCICLTECKVFQKISIIMVNVFVLEMGISFL